MKRTTSSLRLAIIAASMAASVGSAQAAQPVLSQITGNKTEQIKATTSLKARKAVTSQVKSVGGMDLVHEGYAVYGMTPKEYGMRYGHGNKARRSNMLRVSKRARAKHKR